jgi:hypothetical protein
MKILIATDKEYQEYIRDIRAFDNLKSDKVKK